MGGLVLYVCHSSENGVWHFFSKVGQLVLYWRPKFCLCKCLSLSFLFSVSWRPSGLPSVSSLVGSCCWSACVKYSCQSRYLRPLSPRIVRTFIPDFAVRRWHVAGCVLWWCHSRLFSCLRHVWAWLRFQAQSLQVQRPLARTLGQPFWPAGCSRVVVGENQGLRCLLGSRESWRWQLEAPYRCGGEHSLLLAPAHFVFSGPCPCYQHSSFVPGVVCGLPHPHAPLGPGETAETGLQLFLEGQNGSRGSHCGCSGPLSRWILGGGCKVKGSVFVGSVGKTVCHASGFTLSLTPLQWRCFLGPLFLAPVLSLRFISRYCWPGVLSMVMASSGPHLFALASSMTAKSAYLYLLSVNFVPPNKFET